MPAWVRRRPLKVKSSPACVLITRRASKAVPESICWTIDSWSSKPETRPRTICVVPIRLNLAL